MEAITIPNRLKELRLEKKLSLRDLAEKVNISYSALSLAENGKRNLTDNDIQIFCNFYDVTSDYLLGLTDNPNAVVLQVNDADGFSATIEHEIIEKMKGFSVTDFQKVSEYIDFLKSKKKMEEKKNNEK